MAVSKTVSQETASWQDYARLADFRYIDALYQYITLYPKAQPEDLTALEFEHDNIRNALDKLFSRNYWQRLDNYMMTVGRPSDGYMSVRGYWQQLENYIKQALDLATKHELKSVPTYKGNLAILLVKKGDLSTAKCYYQELDTYFSSQNDEAALATNYHNHGQLLELQGDLELAKELYQKSISINTRLGRKRHLADTKHNLGVIAHRLGYFQDARQAYESSLAINREEGNLAAVAMSLHQLGMLAQDTREYVLARTSLEQCLKLKIKVASLESQLITKAQLAILEKLEGNPEKAILILKDCIEQAQQLGQQSFLNNAYYNLALLYEETLDLKAAISALEQCESIEQSLQSPLSYQVQKQLKLLRFMQQYQVL